MSPNSQTALLAALTLLVSGVAAVGCQSSAPAAEVGDAPTPVAEAGAEAAVDASATDGGGGTGDAGTTKTNVAGTRTHSLTVDGLSRELIVHVPASAAGRANAPVVYMFHGGGGTGDDMLKTSGWRELAEKEGVIVVFPTALYYCVWDDDDRNGILEPSERIPRTTRWNQGDLGTPDSPVCTEAEIKAMNLTPAQEKVVNHPLADDVKFTSAMLDFVESSYSVDATRVYATGFSNGGAFTSRLALELSDRFAAIVASSGGLRVQGIAKRALPVMLTWGSVDKRVTERFPSAPVPLDVTLVADPLWKATMVDPYLSALQLPSSFTYDELQLGGHKTIRFTFGNTSSNGGSYRHLLLEDVDHRYEKYLPGFFWEFFRAYTL